MAARMSTKAPQTLWTRTEVPTMMMTMTLPERMEEWEGASEALPPQNIP